MKADIPKLIDALEKAEIDGLGIIKMTAEVRDVIVDALKTTLKTTLKTKIGDQKNQIYLKMSQNGEYWCPNCRIRVIMHYPHKFCANCGQAFKE